MVVIIISITLVLFLVLITWTWKNLGNIDTKKKVAYICISIIIMTILTYIIFSIAKSGVEYKNVEMIGPVRLTLVSVFTALNGFVVMQSIGKIIGKINRGEIKSNEEIKRKLITILAIFIIVAVLECFYMKNIQLDILKTLSNMKH